MLTSAVVFRDSWVDLKAFDTALAKVNPHALPDSDVRFIFPPGCKIMVDAGLRLLSLVNQLASATKRVCLEFQEDEEGTLGYLNRIGFFDHLDMQVEVIPARPAYSGAQAFRGHTTTVVEIEPIPPEGADSNLPTRLADALGASSCAGGSRLVNAGFTVFAELIDNIPAHAKTRLSGYAALQVYKNGGRAKVAVSDSGLGILGTLRPSLGTWNRRAAALDDTDLVVEAFRTGLSRHGKGRGCGLKTSAAHALQFKAELDVRLPQCRVHLIPSLNGYRPHVAQCSSGLPLIWGTHICFDFRLDK